MTSALPTMSVVGGIGQMSHAEATARVREINREMGELDRRRARLAEELEMCMERQRETVGGAR